jgi:hypothetical protein
MTSQKRSIPTKQSILERLGKSPAQFFELSGFTRRHNNPSRTAARAACDALKAEGLVMLIYIGEFQYYILNTEAAKRQAILQQIEESSRHDAATGCTIWAGYCDQYRGPTMRQALVSKVAGVNVRRWLFQDFTGRALEGNTESIKMKARCDEDCINPEHMVRKSRSALLKGIPKPESVKIAMQAAMRKKWGKRSDAVEIIRSSDKSNAQLAQELDMTPSNVWSIRARRTYKLERNPFSGLGARA